MQREPQDTAYRPDPAILPLARWLGAPVQPAQFPQTQLRFRNDKAAKEVGLAGLSDAEWIAHFGRFEPLADNLPEPLALKYHGHQFHNYNPDIGDGRGFLFAQMRDDADRLLDLGTKGSGQTPYSRAGDGRLTLKGAVRELLATEFLQALGCNTSRTFSIIETGEELMRGDEPSPTRSAVLIRLNHGHIRIGTFQRLLAIERPDEMKQLVDYCLTQFPGPEMPKDVPGQGEPAVRLMHHLVERMADLAASYMVAGFVHGVLNTDNMNVSGESFDYGPWRWLPEWNPSFTAAYFDRNGLYAFGRQPEAMHWNCGQFAVALRLIADAPPLIAALDRYGPLYMDAIARRWCWRLGVAQSTPKRDPERDGALIAASERTMRETGETPDAFFFRHRAGRGATGDMAEALCGYEPVAPGAPGHDYWNAPEPQSMLIEEVEDLWSHIDERDDWQPLYDKVAALRMVGAAHGMPPFLAGTVPTRSPD
ncbi:MAG: YdiU family protein [Pontixanthobacter sp.]